MHAEAERRLVEQQLPRPGQQRLRDQGGGSGGVAQRSESVGPSS